MAIEGIQSAAASYQTTPAIQRPVEPPKGATQAAENFSTADTAQTVAMGTSATAELSRQSDQENGQQGSEDQQQRQNEKIKKAVEELNKKSRNTEAVYGFHEKTNRVTIKIVDKETKDTIKEFPAEETLDMIAKAWELAGLMVDEKR